VKTEKQRLPVMEEFKQLAARVADNERNGIKSAEVKRSEQIEQATKNQRINSILRAIDIPARYHAADLDKAPPEAWQAAAGVAAAAQHAEYRERLRRFVATYGIIALLGKRGTGKTDLAFGALKAGANLFKRGKYIKAADLFIDIEGTWSKSKERGGPDLKTILTRLSAPHILVIDELSEMQADRDWQAGRLTYIIDQRYDRKLATILISNDTPENFTRNMGESCMSRLSERGRILICQWPSFRKVLSEVDNDGI
jgi:DNA replication protein DnaC